MDSGDRILWIIIFIFFCFAAYFAVAETAFAASSKVRIKAAAECGSRRAKRALSVLNDFDHAVTTILIGTNITHLGIASIVTVIVIRTWGDAYVTASTLITTIAVFFLSEMLPKSVAKRYPESLALATAGSLSLFMKLFFPVSFVLTKIGQTAAKMVGEVEEVTVTEEELHDIIEDMTDDGSLDEEQSELLSSALDFGDVTVASIITARGELECLSLDTETPDVVAFLLSHDHSRFPVLRKGTGRVVGTLRKQKYLKEYQTNKEIRLSQIIDKPLFAKKNDNVSDLIDHMNRHKKSMAVIVDDRGYLEGIVTIEDALESLVGTAFGGIEV